MADFAAIAAQIVRALEILGDFLQTHSGLAVVSFVSSIAGSIAAVVSLALLGSHRKAQRNSWDTQRLLYLHGYLAGPEQMAARRALRDRPDIATWDGPEDIYADQVSAAYDQAGILLLAPGIVNQKQTRYLLRTSWGKSICDQHEAIRKREIYRTQFGPPKLHKLDDHFPHFGKLVIATQAARQLTLLERLADRLKCLTP